MGVTKEQILSHTNNGWDIYMRFDPNFKVLGKNHQNPFTKKQKTPSFNIYKQNGSYLFKDFDAEETGCSGDAFNFAAMHYNLDAQSQFPEILEQLSKDFNVGGAENGNGLNNNKNKFTVPADKKKFKISRRAKLTETEKTFFAGYAISEDVLKRYGVKTLESYSDGEKTNTAGEDQVIVAFPYGGDAFKIYKPHTRDFRFRLPCLSFF